MNRQTRRSVLRALTRPSPNPAAPLLYSLRDALVKAPKSSSLRGTDSGSGAKPANRSAGRSFDRLHVGVREPEMMADLMDEDMGDDFAERVLAVAPEVEQRPAIEPDHVGQFARLLDRAALGEPPAAKQAKEVEFALGPHLVERLVVREIDYLDDQTLAQAPKRSGEPVERRLGEGVD